MTSAQEYVERRWTALARLDDDAIARAIEELGAGQSVVLGGPSVAPVALAA